MANIDAQMLDGGAVAEGMDAKVEVARRKLADCDDRLGKYRAALDSGADPVVVTGWMSEVQAERLTAEAVLAAAAPSEPLSAAALRSIIEELGDMGQVLAEAEPKDKAEVYAGLGIEVTYRPDQGLVSATARPLAGVQQSVSEGGLELRRQWCRTVVKNPNRLVSSSPGTPPLPIHDGKSGQIRGVWWNGGGTGTYLSINSCAT